MTKQDYAVRVAYLGVATKEVAEAIGALPSKVSDAVNVSVSTPAQARLRSKVDEYTVKLANERRAEIKAALAGTLKGDVQVILPADNRIVVVMDGELIGFYDPIGKRFAPVG